MLKVKVLEVLIAHQKLLKLTTHLVACLYLLALHFLSFLML